MYLLNSLKDARKSSNDLPEKTNHPQEFRNDTPFLEKNESNLLSLEENTITEIKNNATDKISVVSSKNLLKKVMHDEENLESLDLYTVTFPDHLKQGLHSAKFDSLVLAPDSLDTTFLEDKKNCNKQSNEDYFRDCTNKAENKLDEEQNLKNNGKLLEDKGSGKRLSSDSLNDDRIKRCNTGKQSESSKNNETNSKLAKSKDIKSCSASIPKITVTQEASDIVLQMERKNSSVRKDINVSDVSVPKKKSVTSIKVDSKNETPKNSNLLNVVNKNKLPISEISPSLLPTNINVRPKITGLEDISNDNDDFQEQIPSIKNIQNEDSWDACDKKKSVVKKRVIKSIKTTSKYKMTLDAPALNYKKPSYKQTKLSKSIFQPKSSAVNKKSSNRLSEIENIIPVVTVEEDAFPTAQEHYLTSTPYDPIKSPGVIDIDATFVPENFNLENKQCITTNVKKNAVEKSHLKNGSLFSNISFPEELQSVTSENLIENANGNFFFIYISFKFNILNLIKYSY